MKTSFSYMSPRLMTGGFSTAYGLSLSILARLFAIPLPRPPFPPSPEAKRNNLSAIGGLKQEQKGNWRNGTLGRLVRILNRVDPCWRWLETRPDSSRRPTARLFRKPLIGDWDGVTAEAKASWRGVRGVAGRAENHLIMIQ